MISSLSLSGDGMITSDRNEYIATHVTRLVKDALDLEAHLRKVSRSKLIYEALLEYLKRRGYDGLLD